MVSVGAVAVLGSGCCVMLASGVTAGRGLECKDGKSWGDRGSRVVEVSTLRALLLTDSPGLTVMGVVGSETSLGVERGVVDVGVYRWMGVAGVLSLEFFRCGRLKLCFNVSKACNALSLGVVGRVPLSPADRRSSSS